MNHDLFDTILSYTLHIVLGLVALFLVLLVLTLVEKPYGRAGKRKSDESGGQTPSDSERSVEDSRDQEDQAPF